LGGAPDPVDDCLPLPAFLSSLEAEDEEIALVTEGKYKSSRILALTVLMDTELIRN
jgi:hypothetical protein